MVSLTTKFYALKRARRCIPYIKIFKRNYIEGSAQPMLEKKIHPYKQIHPWKSLREFAEDLINNIIYNKDGLVVLNKPYGIRRSKLYLSSQNKYNNIPNGVDYTLEDVLPYICNQLNYSKLDVVRCPEVYMSGITFLAADANVENAVRLAYVQSHFFANNYWIITVGVPRKLEGQHRLGIRLISNPDFKHQKAIITTSWSNHDEKYRKIKLLKTEYKVLSNSTLNLCSLVQIKSSTEKRHALRLFASTFLYCPILGDNICASQVQKIGNTFVKVDPFLTHPATPKLDENILKLLNVNPKHQNIIPAHIHLRSVILPMFKNRNNLTLEAPLLPPFDWTCKQLELKYSLQSNISSE